MIVKVQLSLKTTEARRQVLVYNEDRSVRYEGDATDEIVDLVKGRSKSFCCADILRDGTVSLTSVTDWRDW